MCAININIVKKQLLTQGLFNAKDLNTLRKFENI